MPIKLALYPGHYPEKPGAVNKKHNLYEHFASVNVIHRCVPLLENKGYVVDTFVGHLPTKTRRINNGNFDAAFDLHFNADPETEDTDNKRGYGVLTLYYPGSKTRRKQAEKISEAIYNKIGTRNLGAMEGYYWGGEHPGTIPDYFLRKTICPSFILEPGFIDNNEFTEKFLLSNDGLNTLAEAIVSGIEAVLGEL